MPDISVIIPSYNAYASLDICLKALINQETKVTYEIIVVDCSTNNRVKDICSQYKNIRYLYESKRFNPGVGRNIGAKNAQGALLVFVDCDVILDVNAIEEINNAYKQDYKVFGGALELYRKNVTLAALIEHYYFNHESQKSRPISRRNNLSSALFICDKEIFWKFGGFKDIPRMQDTELTERISSAGMDLYLIPKVIGYQIQDSPLMKVFRKIYITGVNLYFIRYSKKGLFYQLIIFIALPLLSFCKITRIIIRNLTYNDIYGKICAFLLTPFLYFAGFLWMLGLYRSMIFKDGISKER